MVSVRLATYRTRAGLSFTKAGLPDCQKQTWVGAQIASSPLTSQVQR